MSHISITYHIILATHRRAKTILESHERELYKFLYEFSTDRNIKIWRIGGMPDHIHILCDIPPTIAVAEFIRSLKTESSKFMKINPHFPQWESWSAGYGIFSIESKNRISRINYIKNQKEHHRSLDFIEEYKNFLHEYDIDSDYLLGS